MHSFLSDPLAAVRTIHFASVAVLVGLLLFVRFVAAPAIDRARAGATSIVARFYAGVGPTAWVSLGVAVASGVAWLIFLAAKIDGRGVAAAFADGAPWTLLTETQFGEVWLARLALSGLIALLLWRFDRGRGWRTHRESMIAVALSAVLIAALAGAGHGAAGGMVELAADAIHLVAAGGWVGGLVPFFMFMALAHRDRGPTADRLAAEITRRFSTFGVVVVGALLATGIVNSWYLVGSLPHLVGTDYGRLLLVKIALFIVMAALAATNRFWLMPHLRSPRDSDTALRRIALNGGIELILGSWVLLIVGALGTTPPAAHTQPTWPFDLRLTFAALADPAQRVGLAIAITAAAAGIAAVAGSAMIRRRRWTLLGIAAALIGASVPYLSALTEEAFPTSFYASPTGFSAESIAAGSKLFGPSCAICHGANGRGDGPAAKDLRPPPADLTAAHIYGHRDGDLYWWISHGIGTVMPGFGAALDDTARWNLVDYIHANADARRLAEAGAGTPVAVRMPGFAVDCPDGSTLPVAAFRGRMVHLLVAGPLAAARLDQLALAPADPAIETIAIMLDRQQAPAICDTGDADAVTALALYRGGMDQLDGTEFLIDETGWLRAMWYPGLLPDWRSPQAFQTVVAGIRRNRAPAPATEPHHHTH